MKCNDGTPKDISSEPDTGELRAAAYGPEMLEAGTMTSDEVLSSLATAVAKINGNGEKEKKFLSVSVSSWTKMLIAYVVGAAVVVAGWHLTVRDRLNALPTGEDVKQEVRAGFETHDDSSKAHPPIQDRLDDLSENQRKIRESQIRQEETDKAQTETLKVIQVDISRIRRNGRSR